MPDDYSSTTQTTGAVEVGGSATGEIETRSDRDWFAVTLEAGRIYRIDLEGSDSRGGTLRDPYLRGVHDADGNLLAVTTDDDGGAGYNSRVFFRAEEAATYYVAAGAYGTRRGTYTLSVTDATDSAPDDFAATTQTTGAVAVGGSATGEIEIVGDRDWFAVTLEAGKTYWIDVEGSESGAGTLYFPYLRGVHDADGVLITASGDNSRLTFTAEEDGAYYVATGASGTRRGTYTLSVMEVTDDFSAETGTSGAVVVGGSATGEIEFEGDRDWFAVTLEAGRTYQIDLEGWWTGAGTLADPYLRGIYNADGVRFAGTTDDDGGTDRNSRVEFRAEENATYYVAAGAWREREGAYTLSVSVAEDPDDLEEGTGTSGAVAVDGSATGEIDYRGDRDWFAVTLEAGKAYEIDLEGSPTGAGTLEDPYLRGVYDANGNLIAGTTNDDGGAGRNSRVEFTAGEDATYYVAAGAYANRKGTYTLSVTEVPDDFEEGTGTSGAVAVGGSATGEIETGGDRDWFAVELDAGSTYLIDLEGASTGAGTLFNPYLYGVHDAEGVLISGTTDDYGGVGYNSRVTFTAEDAGAYYVAAGAGGNWEGAYTLSVTEVPDDFEEGTGTSGAVAVGGSATGEIEIYGDRDWFAVTLEAGSTYRIDLEGSWTGAGTLYNPYLYGVHDAEGVLIAGTTDDNGGEGANSRVTFTAEDAGTYYVAAGAGGNWEGAYTLSVTEVPDDFEAGIGTSGAVAVGGSATGEIETGGDRDWFAVTLEAGSTYEIDLEGASTGNGTLYNPYLYGVHDAEGVLIAGTTDDNGGVGYNSRVTFTAADTGAYYVAAGAWVYGEGAYKLSVEDVTDDFEATTQTTGTVEVDGSATGEIEIYGDRDWFAVTLEAGRTYRIDLEGSWTGAGTLYNPYLYGVHDAEGVLIAGTTDDNGGEGANSRVTFTAEDAGTYYVAAGAGGNWEGAYTLSVTEVPDDFEAGIGTIGAVAVGGSATGEIDFNGDRDWFAVEFEAGRTYQIDLEGSWTGGGTLFNPYLYGVHDAEGVLIAGTTDDNGGVGYNSRVLFTAADTGAYYVAAGAGGNWEGAYTLSVAEVTDDFEAGTGTSGAVAVGGSATGEIEAGGDRDWFAVALDAGRTYRIDLEGWWTGADTLSDSYLYGVHDANGDLIAGTTDDDGGAGRNSRVDFTAEEDATYYVAAGAYGSREGTYTLSVVDITNGVPDDFAAGIGTSGAVAVGGSATGDIEFEGDQDWFAVTLEAGRTYRIDLEGSPTGNGTLRDPYLYGVHDANGDLIAGTTDDNGGEGRNSRVDFTAQDAGAYYVAAGAQAYWEGSYTLSVAEVPDDFEAGIGTSGAVAVGGSATGEIDFNGDRDWFAVTLEAGRTYRIDLEGSPTGDGALGDPYLYGVHDANGDLIAGTTDDNGGEGRNSYVEFTAQDAGAYYVAAGAQAYWEGSYTLSVEEVM